jgi:hypothetical protein
MSRYRKSSQGDGHPYTKGLRFWGAILDEWIASPMYSKKAKEEFKASKERLRQSHSISSIDPTLK